MTAARDDILRQVRAALNHTPSSAPSTTTGLPPESLTRLAEVRRPAGEREADLAQLLIEAGKLGVKTRRVTSQDDLRVALEELVRAEGVSQAVVWDTPDLRAMCVPSTLAELGVELVPVGADKRAIAACELGVTQVDAALPETGTLVLTSAPDKPRMASLVPRVHLAILRPSALRADLSEVFAEVKQRGYYVFVTGPSRTADIELTLTIGVHGPAALYLWVIDEE